LSRHRYLRGAGAIGPSGSRDGLWAVSTTTVTGGGETTPVPVLVLLTIGSADSGMEYGVIILDGGRDTGVEAAGAESGTKWYQ
jgi:hypothetical protein